jgi:hypothetical protein
MDGMIRGPNKISSLYGMCCGQNVGFSMDGMIRGPNNLSSLYGMRCGQNVGFSMDGMICFPNIDFSMYRMCCQNIGFIGFSIDEMCHGQNDGFIFLHNLYCFFLSVIHILNFNKS